MTKVTIDRELLERQRKARRAVRGAINAGLLFRPDTCSRCGDKPATGIDGRTRIHAHHHDYSKPLEVEWLCVQCHRDETPIPYGTRNGAAQLDQEAVIDILTSKLSSRAIGAKYGVDKRTVLRVRNGETWQSIC